MQCISNPVKKTEDKEKRPGSLAVQCTCSEDGTLALDVGNELGVELALGGGLAVLGSEGGGWDPLGGGARGSFFHHLVDLLERKTLGLWHQEVGVDEGTGAETAPDEEDGRAEVALVLADHVRGDDSNDLKPVSGELISMLTMGGDLRCSRASWRR